jgi:hypothetical protein
MVRLRGNTIIIHHDRCFSRVERHEGIWRVVKRYVKGREWLTPISTS